jgi:glycosyltransferase involved in cell wall biosynthesis
MRILQVSDRLSDRGGAYTWLLGILDGLVGYGHDVCLVVGADDGTVTAPCPVEIRPGLEARVGQRVGIEATARAFAPDVVHVHNVTNPAALEWAAGRPDALVTIQDHRFFCPTRGKWTLAGEPCRRPMALEICTDCFEDGRYFREVHALTERRLAALRRAAAVTVLSRYMREELVAAGVPPHRVRVVPPFVHGLPPAAAEGGPPCVLFVGRLAAAKGVGDAVEAWRRSGVDLPLVLAGTGPLRGALERQARSREGPPILVTGWVDRTRLSGLYHRARALLLPSRWQEPFGIAGIEALSFGVPVVAWESGAVSEWHPGPGLVRWGDVDALAGALADAVEQRVARPPAFPRDEALGRLTLLYGRLAGVTS